MVFQGHNTETNGREEERQMINICCNLAFSVRHEFTFLIE